MQPESVFVQASAWLCFACITTTSPISSISVALVSISPIASLTHLHWDLKHLENTPKAVSAVETKLDGSRHGTLDDKAFDLIKCITIQRCGRSSESL